MHRKVMEGFWNMNTNLFKEDAYERVFWDNNLSMYAYWNGITNQQKTIEGPGKLILETGVESKCTFRRGNAHGFLRMTNPQNTGCWRGYFHYGMKFLEFIDVKIWLLGWKRVAE